MFSVLIISFILLIYILKLLEIKKKHKNIIDTIPHRIHVNGIRGKSSVTRLISASLREGNLHTLGKTTGSATRVIISHRSEMPVERNEATIGEQRRVLMEYVKKSKKKYDAIVFECMAINPLYQKYLEEKIMHSTIGVITNVREDHTDLLGETLPEIATNLSSTIPSNGHLVTSETNEEILGILREECKKRNTKLHSVGAMRISNKNIARFKHFEYKSNVAIAIKVAQLVGIDKETALKGMLKASSDPGAFKLRQVRRKKTNVHWANLFAINDKESFILTVEALSEKVGPKVKKAVILNNRGDRPERVSQFVNICVKDINVDYIFTFGDYEHQVRQELSKHPGSEIQTVNLGNSSSYKNSSGTKLLDTIVSTFNGQETILFGAVNIHTPQAISFLSKIEGKNKYVN